MILLLLLISPTTAIYLPFEELSLTNKARPGVCHPPKGTPQRCCLGGTSSGGNVYWKPNLCNFEDNFAHVEPYETKFTISKLMVALHKHNYRLTIIGDSLMYQNTISLECGWLREGIETISKNHTKWNKNNWQYGIGTSEHFVVNVSRPVLVDFYLQYRPEQDMTQPREAIAASNVVLINSGLHFLDNSIKLFQTNTRDYLQMMYKWVTEPGHRRVLVWRENTAQHRDALGGEWNEPKKSNECKPLNWTNHQRYKWRDRMVQQIAQDVGFTIIDRIDLPFTRQRHDIVPLYWISFYAYTAKFHFFHPHMNGKCEPSHYCQDPLFWTPVWEQLLHIIRHSE